MGSVFLRRHPMPSCDGPVDFFFRILRIHFCFVYSYYSFFTARHYNIMLLQSRTGFGNDAALQSSGSPSIGEE